MGAVHRHDAILIELGAGQTVPAICWSDSGNSSFETARNRAPAKSIRLAREQNEGSRWLYGIESHFDTIKR